MNRLKVQNITKIFQNPKTNTTVQVLLGANAEFYDHDINFILGPSGCGKTTFLRILAGHISATAGDVLLGNQRVDAIPSSGFLLQEPEKNVFLDKSIQENFELVAEINRIKDVEPKMNSLLKTFELNVPISKQARRLSVGQIQRLGLCLNLFRSPEVLLLDEPTSHLDRKNAVLIVKVLRKYLKSHSTLIIATTHDRLLAKEGNTLLLYRGIFIKPGIKNALREFSVQKEYYEEEVDDSEIQLKAKVMPTGIALPKVSLSIFQWRCGENLQFKLMDNTLHFCQHEVTRPSEEDPSILSATVLCEGNWVSLIFEREIPIPKYSGYVFCNQEKRQITLIGGGGIN